MMRPLLSRFAAAAPHAFEEPAGRWQGARLPEIARDCPRVSRDAAETEL